MPPRLGASFVLWLPIEQGYQIAQEARPTTLWLRSVEVGTPTSTAKLTSSQPRWPTRTDERVMVGMPDKDAAAKGDRALQLYWPGLNPRSISRTAVREPKEHDRDASARQATAG